RSTIDQSIKMLAKRDYKLDVDVKQKNDTVTVRLQVKNLIGELMAPDQMVWTQIDNAMEALSRVALSVDRSPLFIVLDVTDLENHSLHIFFTRCTLDLRKLMAEAQSRTEYQDRLLMELEVDGVRRPLQMDPVWIMMMASEAANDEDAKTKPDVF